MKTCIITGASSGIGRAAAIDISYSGDYKNIAIVGRNEERLLETKRCMNPEMEIMLVVFDIENLNGIPELVTQIHKKYSSIDCLVNIAGYTDPQPLVTMSINSMEKTYAINLFAPLIFIRECVKYMKFNEEGAKILNVASTAGLSPRPGWLSYASSKAALIYSSSTLAEELAEYKIRVYCISPGRCATELRRKLAPNEDQTKIMQPEEVGSIICDLVSSKDACLDGQNIVVRKKSF